MVVVLVAVAVPRPCVDRGLLGWWWWFMGWRWFVRWRGWGRWRRGWWRRRFMRRRRWRWRRWRRLVRRRLMRRRGWRRLVRRRVVRRPRGLAVMRRFRAVSRRLRGVRRMRSLRSVLLVCRGFLSCADRLLRRSASGLRRGRRVDLPVAGRGSSCRASRAAHAELGSDARTGGDDDPWRRQVRAIRIRQQRWRRAQQNYRTRLKRRCPQLPGEGKRRASSDEQDHAWPPHVPSITGGEDGSAARGAGFAPFLLNRCGSASC